MACAIDMNVVEEFLGYVYSDSKLIINTPKQGADTIEYKVDGENREIPYELLLKAKDKWDKEKKINNMKSLTRIVM